VGRKKTTSQQKAPRKTSTASMRETSTDLKSLCRNGGETGEKVSGGGRKDQTVSTGEHRPDLWAKKKTNLRTYLKNHGQGLNEPRGRRTNQKKGGRP